MKYILLIAMVGAMVWAVDTGMDKQAKIDCQTWKTEASTYEAFYLTHDQKMECDAIGVAINAPVK